MHEIASYPRTRRVTVTTGGRPSVVIPAEPYMPAVPAARLKAAVAPAAAMGTRVKARHEALRQAATEFVLDVAERDHVGLDVRDVVVLLAAFLQVEGGRSEPRYAHKLQEVAERTFTHHASVADSTSTDGDDEGLITFFDAHHELSQFEFEDLRRLVRPALKELPPERRRELLAQVAAAVCLERRQCGVKLELDDVKRYLWLWCVAYEHQKPVHVSCGSVMDPGVGDDEECGEFEHACPLCGIVDHTDSDEQVITNFEKE